MDFDRPWFLGNDGIEAYLRADNFVVLDWETTNKQNGSFTSKDNDLVLGCWTIVKNGTVTKKHIFGNEYEYQELLDDIAKADFLVAHNAQFELGWLARCGLDLRTVLCYCTMVGEWVIHGNITVPFNLEDTLRRYGLGGKESLVSKLIKNKVCPSLIPRSWLLLYCERDVEATLELFYKQRKKIMDEDLWHIILSRNLTIPVLADIQAAGAQLDAEGVTDEHSKLTGIVESLGKELDEITGGINLGSPKQLSHFLYEVMKFKKVKDKNGESISSTGKDVVAQLEASSEEQRKFLELYKEYNKASSLLSKNVNFFVQVCKHLHGVYHSAIVQCRTATHRLAGSGIPYLFPGLKTEMRAQPQNLPRIYKKLFTAHDDDYVVLETDGAGMEFRVATIVGKDEQARDDIIGGADIHAATRDKMNEGYKKHNVNKVIDRQEAKSSTFSPLYGGRGKDEAEQEYVQYFKQRYHGIESTQQSWVEQVVNTKKLRLPWGMIFYWPDVKMYRSGHVNKTTEIYNFPIQSLATAEIIPVALVFYWHRINGLPITIWNTVHDSIISRVRRDYVDTAKELSKIAMTSDVYDFFRDVYGYELWPELPLGAGMKVGKYWGVSDTEEVYEVWQSGRERLTVEKNKQKTVIYDRIPNNHD